MNRYTLIIILTLLTLVVMASAKNSIEVLGSIPFKKQSLKEYDLSFKDKKGDVDFFAMRTVYYHGNSIGITQSREEFLCSFKREVLEASPDSLLVKYTWKSFKEGRGSGPSDVITEWKRHPFADGFTYQFDLNGAAYLDAVDFDPVPKDQLGWKFAVNIMDAHAQFECLRNESSGNIGKLRSIGDRVMVNDAHKSSSVDFPPFITDSAFANGDYETIFIGIGAAEGKACAVLEYINTESRLKSKIQVSPQMTFDMEGTSNFWGHIYIDLQTSKLIQGDLYEYVIVSGKSSLPMVGDIRVFERRLVEIRNITEEEFKRDLT